MDGLLPLVHINLANYFLTIVVFLSVVLILSKKAWGPVLKALDDRDEGIRHDLDEAKEAREEAATLLHEQKKAMVALREEGQKIRDEAKKMALKQKQEIVDQAKIEAEQILERTRGEIGREKQAALNEVKELAVSVGLQLSREILKKEISRETHQSMITSSMVELEKAY